MDYLCRRIQFRFGSFSFYSIMWVSHLFLNIQYENIMDLCSCYKGV